eukprot:Clim_evm2s79 gene=Clim_evmTU2s79
MNYNSAAFAALGLLALSTPMMSTARTFEPRETGGQSDPCREQTYELYHTNCEGPSTSNCGTLVSTVTGTIGLTEATDSVSASNSCTLDEDLEISLQFDVRYDAPPKARQLLKAGENGPSLIDETQDLLWTWGIYPDRWYEYEVEFIANGYQCTLSYRVANFTDACP